MSCNERGKDAGKTELSKLRALEVQDVEEEWPRGLLVGTASFMND